MIHQTVRIGTRGSPLALWQARWVQSRLEQHHPGLEVTLVPIKTQGDKILDVPLARVGGKGLFVKELEDALLDGRADLAVHSMKDMPTGLPTGLTLGPILERHDPRDAFLSLHHAALDRLPEGARVGSSSLRRQSQVLARRPDLEVISLRGNIGTRIARLEAGDFDAILLAAAGVQRMALTAHVKEYLEPERMLPAIGQGAVGIELRQEDPRVAALVAPLDHPPTRLRVLAERAFLTTLEGGCQVPIAGHAVLDGDRLILEGLVAGLAGRPLLRACHSGPLGEPEALGRQLARQLLDRGADRILAELYAAAPPSASPPAVDRTAG